MDWIQGQWQQQERTRSWTEDRGNLGKGYKDSFSRHSETEVRLVAAGRGLYLRAGPLSILARRGMTVRGVQRVL